MNTKSLPQEDAMELPPKYHVRVGVDRYHTLSDNQRNAYVAGVLDMLCVAHVYAGPQHKARIVAMVEYATKYDIGQLTEKFDEYVKADSSLDQYGTAGTFFIALGKWCGLDK